MQYYYKETEHLLNLQKNKETTHKNIATKRVTRKVYWIINSAANAPNPKISRLSEKSGFSLQIYNYNGRLRFFKTQILYSLIKKIYMIILTRKTKKTIKPRSGN